MAAPRARLSRLAGPSAGKPHDGSRSAATGPGSRSGSRASPRPESSKSTIPGRRHRFSADRSETGDLPIEVQTPDFSLCGPSFGEHIAVAERRQHDVPRLRRHEGFDFLPGRRRLAGRCHNPDPTRPSVLRPREVPDRRVRVLPAQFLQVPRGLLLVDLHAGRKLYAGASIGQHTRPAILNPARAFQHPRTLVGIEVIVQRLGKQPALSWLVKHERTASTTFKGYRSSSAGGMNLYLQP